MSHPRTPEGALIFPRHKFEFHPEGLSWCKTCGGAEGSLPQDCPQLRMTEEIETQVYAGDLDFRVELGGWTTWTRAKEQAV